MSFVRLIRVVDQAVVGIVPEAPASWEIYYPQPEYRPHASAQLGDLEMPDGGFAPAPEPVIEQYEPYISPSLVVEWAQRKLEEAIADIPENERLTWEQQKKEAQLILANTPDAITPLLSAQSAITGESLALLAQKVIGKASHLLAYSGIVIGIRRKYLDLLQTNPNTQLFIGSLDADLAAAIAAGGQ